MAASDPVADISGSSYSSTHGNRRYLQNPQPRADLLVMIAAALLAVAAHGAVGARQAYECKVTTPKSDRGDFRISFGWPPGNGETFAERRLRDVKVDDPKDVVSYLSGRNIKGRVTRTGVVEIFADIGLSRAWLRIVPDYSSGRYNLTGFYLYYNSHPGIIGDTTGECVEIPVSSPKP